MTRGRAGARPSPDPHFDPERRAVLKTAVCTGVCLGVAPLASFAQHASASRRPAEHDRFVRDGDASLTPLGPEDLPAGGGPVIAWALDLAAATVLDGSRLNRVLLLRFDEANLSPETRHQAVSGVVAYSAICTHEGCEVVDWIAEEQALSCPCHGAKYDPTDGACVLDGPAPRPLPALPLELVDGKLSVARAFTSPVGFGSA